MSTVVLEQPQEESWHAARRTGIGGSEVAALFGLHPFMTALDVYRLKVGEADPTPETSAMKRGRLLEPIAAALYAQETGRKVRRQPMRRHPEHPFLIANIDRQILAGSGEGDHFAPTTASLEIKCPGLRVFWQIKREGLRDYMVLQQQHYATVWGYRWGAFGVLNTEEMSLLHFDIEADEAVQQRIIEVAGNFWHDHVLAGVPPKEDAAVPDVDLPEVSGEVVTREDADWAAAARDLADAKEVKAEAEALYDAAKARLIDLAGGLGTFEGGGVRVYYRQKPGRTTFDRKALAKAGPLDRMKLDDYRAGLVDEIAETLVTEYDETEKNARMIAWRVLGGFDLDAFALDLGAFDKAGAPYTEFRPYVLRAREEW